MKLFWTGFTLLMLLFSPYPVSATETITVCGTGDSQLLLGKLAAAFQLENSDITVVIPDSIGSSGGIRLTAEGKCDLGRVARPLKEKEKTYGLSYMEFASSPVVFIVNENVRLDSISTEQFILIISGKATNWKELGADDGKIYVAKRAKGDSSRTVIEKHIPIAKTIANWAGKTIYTTNETITTVANFPGTFSFAPLAMADSKGIKILNLDNIAPSFENIQSGAYKLQVPLGIVWQGELQGGGKKLVDFIISPAGREIIAQNGAIPVK